MNQNPNKKVEPKKKRGRSRLLKIESKVAKVKATKEFVFPEIENHYETMQGNLANLNKYELNNNGNN